MWDKKNNNHKDTSFRRKAERFILRALELGVRKSREFLRQYAPVLRPSRHIWCIYTSRLGCCSLDALTGWCMYTNRLVFCRPYGPRNEQRRKEGTLKPVWHLGDMHSGEFRAAYNDPGWYQRNKDTSEDEGDVPLARDQRRETCQNEC